MWSISGSSRNPRSWPCGRTGFTLLELLVVLSIISILLSLLVPTLLHARGEARRVQALATMQQVWIGMALYGGDFREAFPFLATPGRPRAPLIVNGADLSDAQGVYFRPQAEYWPSVVRKYFSGRPLLPEVPCFEPRGTSFGLPKDRDDDVLWTRFWLTPNAFAAPEFWADNQPPRNPAYFRATRWDEISFPSQKGVLLDIGNSEWGDTKYNYGASPLELPIWFSTADGASHVRRLKDMKRDTVGREGLGALPVLTTRYGLRGRDF